MLKLVCFLWWASAWASYRVYELKITHHDSQGKVQQTEVVQTTLDPIQYEHYHSGYRTIRAQLLKTWFCPGDTSGNRPYCPKPKK